MPVKKQVALFLLLISSLIGFIMYVTRVHQSVVEFKGSEFEKEFSFSYENLEGALIWDSDIRSRMVYVVSKYDIHALRDDDEMYFCRKSNQQKYEHYMVHSFRVPSGVVFEKMKSLNIATSSVKECNSHIRAIHRKLYIEQNPEEARD